MDITQNSTPDNTPFDEASVEAVTITAFGQDSPGILASFAELLAENQVEIIDMGLVTVKNRFVLVILAKLPVPFGGASNKLEREARDLAKTMGFAVQVDTSSVPSPRIRQGNVVVVAHGRDQATSRSEITRTIASLFRVITANDGDVVDLSLQTSEWKPEFCLTIEVSIPPFKLDFAALEEQLGSVRGASLRVAVIHASVFRSMQRVDTEIG